MEIPSAQMREHYDRYVAAWSAIGDDERIALLKACMADDCMYADNVSYTQGPSELAAVQANFQRKTPGGYFIVDTFFVQHNRALIHWRAMDAGDAVRFHGIDAVIFDQDRMLTQISDFFEKPAGMA